MSNQSKLSKVPGISQKQSRKNIYKGEPNDYTSYAQGLQQKYYGGQVDIQQLIQKNKVIENAIKM